MVMSRLVMVCLKISPMRKGRCHVHQIWKMMKIMTREVHTNDLKEVVNKLIPDCTGKDRKGLPIYDAFNIYIDFREEGRGERDRNISDERESLISCLLHAPYWGSSLQPKHVLLTGIKPGTLQSAGPDALSTEPNQLGPYDAFVRKVSMFELGKLMELHHEGSDSGKATKDEA
ncbi:hypothetical protein QTO34_013541, partial [Cnephaeus nilssonii]